MLTVVIPSYNAQEYLDRAVSSVRGFDQVEVLIVDDGSTDATAAIADGMAQSDPDHIRVIHQENAGHGGADHRPGPDHPIPVQLAVHQDGQASEITTLHY